MNLTQKILIICGCGAVLAGCKKGPTRDDFISFKLDGVAKNLRPEADIFDDGSLMIEAGPDLKDEISLFIDTNFVVKTYHLEDPDDMTIASYYDHKGVDFWSDTGKVVISSFDGDHVKGTFSFTAHPDGSPSSTIHITEGQFSAKVSYLSFSSPDTCACTCNVFTDTCTSQNPFGVGKRNLLRSRYLRHRSMIFGKPATAGKQ